MLQRENTNIFTMRVPIEENKNRNYKMLFTADHHRDNPHCDRRLMKDHFDEAKRDDAPIFCFGDMFCFMQGKGDPRGNKQSVRPEHNTDTYFDTVITDAVDWYGEYANQYAFVSDGNHETAIKKHREIDVLERFCYGMNKEHKSSIIHGPYSGWIKILFVTSKGRIRDSLLIYYHHGSGGGGPVTKGVIQAQRRAVYLTNADITVQGHIHEHRYFPIEQVEMSMRYKERYKTMHNICCGTYKEEWKGGSGWHIERGSAPKPKKMWWVDIRWGNRDNRVKVRFIPAD